MIGKHSASIDTDGDFVERMNSISPMMKNASRDMIPRDMFPVN